MEFRRVRYTLTPSPPAIFKPLSTRTPPPPWRLSFAGTPARRDCENARYSARSGRQLPTTVYAYFKISNLCALYLNQSWQIQQQLQIIHKSISKLRLFVSFVSFVSVQILSYTCKIDLSTGYPQPTKVYNPHCPHKLQLSLNSLGDTNDTNDTRLYNQ